MATTYGIAFSPEQWRTICDTLQFKIKIATILTEVGITTYAAREKAILEYILNNIDKLKNS